MLTSYMSSQKLTKAARTSECIWNILKVRVMLTLVKIQSLSLMVFVTALNIFTFSALIFKNSVFSLNVNILHINCSIRYYHNGQSGLIS